jgi:predicted O-methyltransferase YrrM
MTLNDNLRSAYIQQDVDEYIYALLPKGDAVVCEIEAYAAEHDVPIVGPAVARLLALLVQISGEKRIFEMGSAIGYSTLWLAGAVGEDGKVFYTDGSSANADRARGYLERAGLARRVEIQVGDAATVLKQTPGDFDFIFNDIDKHQYPEAFRLAVTRLRRGGLLVTDNTLWSGKAARLAAADDHSTRGVQELNRLAFSSPELYSVLIPLRDGVTVCRKL